MVKSTHPTEEFPERLRAARELRGLNQSELAQRALAWQGADGSKTERQAAEKGVTSQGSF